MNARAASPRRFDTLTEPHRAAIEHATYLHMIPSLVAAHAGEGCGHNVLVIPGLMTSDPSTTLLRHTLHLCRYRPHGWRQGLNIGPTRRIMSGIDDQIHRLTDAEGGPVSVVGWSLGGLLAQDLAQRLPDHVERVVTLGSPVGLIDQSQSSVAALYRIFTPLHMPEYETEKWLARDRAITQPFTSIHSKSDGIVHWRASLIEEGPRAENVEIRGSHCGLGANAAAARVVLNRLAEPIATWQPHAASAGRRRPVLATDRLAA